MILQRSRRRAMMHAISQIVEASGATDGGQIVPFTGVKFYGPPTANQIQQYGTPFLHVMRAQLVGYSPDGDQITMDLAQGSGLSTQPVWDFVVVTFHPYDEDNPNYDDADDDAENIRLAVKQFWTLPLTVTVQAAPAPTTTSFAVDPGFGKMLSIYRPITMADGTVAPIFSIVGDVVTLNDALLTAPTPGVQASQDTCINSYAYSVQPDYAQLTDGTPYCVGYAVVRAFEDLVGQYP